MATQYRANRVETPQRWTKALDRAIAAGIEPLQIAGTGEWVVTSATRIGTVYRTDGFQCECEAGLAGDPVCQHRAVVRQILDYFNQSVPALTTECGSCNGRGWNYAEAAPGAFPYRVECPRCSGRGTMPLPSRIPTPPVTNLAAD